MSTPDAEPKPAKSKRHPAVYVIVIAFLGVVAFAIINAIGNAADGKSDTQKAVEEACQSTVVSHLKAPSTAEFVGGPVASDRGTGRWDVDGSVDAQNSFGAMVRTSYTCVIEPQDDGSMRVVYFDTE